MKTTTLLKLMATVLLIVASAAFLAACSGSSDEDPGAAGDAAEHFDDSVDANGDADEHSDADQHSDAVEVVVTMTDQLKFEPNEITVEAGRPVLLTIENAGLALHDFTIGEMAVHVSHSEGASDDMAHMEGQEHDNAVHMALDGGATGTVEFTPEEAGEYQFHCTVLGHTESGMFGTLIVTEA
jgi:uncharacterized cupredoxin-like copper-binding protein